MQRRAAQPAVRIIVALAGGAALCLPPSQRLVAVFFS
jgi:hypothetical protein